MKCVCGHPMLYPLKRGNSMRETYKPMMRRRQANEVPPSSVWEDEYEDAGDQLLGKGVAGGGLVTSIVDREERKHVPTLDLDVPVALYPSRTNGNWHLMIDTPMPWWKYSLLLRVLSLCGVIEKGYSDVSRKRGYSAIRKPLQVKRRAAEDRIRDVWETDPNTHFYAAW